MKKKIFKRSLTLGALMAFVITGSAWAESWTIVSDTDFETLKADGWGITTREEQTWSYANGLSGNNMTLKGDPLTSLKPELDDVVKIAGGSVCGDSFLNMGTANISGNTITFDGATYSGKVYCGELRFTNGNLINNKIYFSNGSDVSGMVLGGTNYGGSGELSGNRVEVKDSFVSTSLVAGAYAHQHITENYTKVAFYNNGVVVDHSTVNGTINGVQNNGGEGDTINNYVTIKDSTVNGLVYGVHIGECKGDIKNNIVTIDHSTVNRILAGVYHSEGNLGTANGDIVGNEIYIKGASTINGSVYSVIVNPEISANVVENNNLYIDGGIVSQDIFGVGSWGNIKVATGNNIFLKDVTILGDVYASLAINNIETISNNMIALSGIAKVNNISAYYGQNVTNACNNILQLDSSWSGGENTGTLLGYIENFDTIDIGWEEAKNLEISTLVANPNTANGTNNEVKFRVNDVGTTVQVGSFSNTSQKTIAVEGTSRVADQLGSQGDINTAIQNLADNISIGGETNKVTQVSTEEGKVYGAVSAEIDENGKVKEGTLQVPKNKTNEALSETGTNLKAHWRTHMNDMNKRMGELRNANGEHGVWTRMVRGENEYQGAKAQYNQYQLGYDEKLSVDKRWTVGAAVTFAEADGNFAKGSTEDKSTAFAIYGSKLNNDGTFIDLIARYARLESDVDMYSGDKGDYSTNGYSVSAEFGKRFTKENGFWVEPQLELTYGSIDSADFEIAGRNVHYDRMNSFITRAGFAIGKNIKQGNVYARASYLYDFDGEADTIVTAPGVTGGDPHKEDLGDGWWEVGVGANFNLSDATYIYADVEKTFGGEVDTNWQWNLGVRYSF